MASNTTGGMIANARDIVAKSMCKRGTVGGRTMPRVESQRDFDARLKLMRLSHAKMQKHLEDTIRRIVREELKSCNDTCERRGS